MGESAKSLRATDKKNAASNKKAPKGAIDYKAGKDKGGSTKVKTKKKKTKKG